ncbi:PAS domain S-box protein [Hydrogenophaga sp.]|uniref:PAS domain S-box protein n=1 Tax=Hydrogenophaga sp. TaxID=1904254 RepID=UPI00272B9BBC|nr:PAS domain S-box protein [Hydrogenophaga sp.]
MTTLLPVAELSQLSFMRTRGVLRTTQDQSLNDIVRVAAHALRSPMALVSLVDEDRQWFKAGHGIEHGGSDAGLPAYTHAVPDHDVLVLPDARLDPRFASDASVTGVLGLVFFAGAPIRHGGRKVGVLCVMDRQPRTLDAEERGLMLDMAQAIEHWLASQSQQEQLLQREAAFRQLAEHLPGIVYRDVLDGAPSTPYVSPRIRDLGYTPEQWLDQPDAWLRALHPDDRERVLDEQAEGLEAGEPFALRYRLRHAAGGWRHIEDVVRVEMTANGPGMIVNGVMFDVTERQVARQARNQVFKQLPFGVLIVDAEERILDVNPHAERLLGRSAAELSNRSIKRLFVGAPGGSSSDGDSFQRVNGAQGTERDYWHPDGEMRCFEEVITALDDGNQMRVLRDISRRREDEGWLRKLSMAAEQASESIVITDLAANIEYVNEAATRSSGYSREELLGRNSRLLQSGMTPRSRYRKLWARLQAGQPWRGFLSNRRKDGSHYIEYAVISPVRSPDGRITNYLAVKEDITEKRRMSEDLERYRNHLEELVEQRTGELERARRAAEMASAAKSAFLATMSHEIRTPMNGVIGLADVLRETGLTPHQKDLTDTLRESAFVLLTLIDDILDFSKIEAGRLELECVPVVLRSLVEKASDVLRPMASARDVRLHAFVDPALPPQVLGDAARIRQIVLNLVGNAIKFSADLGRPGRVSLRALPAPDGGVRLVVSDNGIGMSEEVQRRIFQPFVQGEAATTRTYGGTGLGLVICQRLVDAMGGSIGVQSEPGAGAVFCVDLPLTGVPGAHRRTELNGLHCHLWLDDPERASDWATYVVAAGGTATVHDTLPGPAVNASENVVWILDRELMAPGAETDGALVILLPRVEVCRGLQTETRTLGPGRVELDGEGLRCMQLLRAVLLATGRELPDLLTEPEPAAFVPSHDAVDRVLAVAQGRVILVAEDNLINRKVIGHQLDLMGLASEQVGDGEEALARWRADPARYGLLLTDLHMPLLNGFDLTAAIRREEAPGRRLPVIALTANQMGSEDGRYLAAGMDGYLSKPVPLTLLQDTLRYWLTQTSAPSAAPPPPASTPNGFAAPPPGTDRPAFDDQALERLVGPEADVQLELRQRYLGSLDAAMAEIAHAVAAQDWRAVGMTAHRLKSSSRAVGALGVGQQFEGMETAGRDNDGDAVHRLMPGLGEAVDAVHRHFRHLQTGGGDPVGRVICVDDDPVQLDALQQQLQALGVHGSERFTEGGSLLERLDLVDTTPVLLLIDLNMPHMDGVELIGHLAHIHFAGALALVVGPDPRVIDTAERLARAHGLNTLGHLRKPVHREALSALLQRWPRFKTG